MIVDTSKTVVNTNVSEAQAFNIAINAQAFAALSGGIYTNVIKSLVRELISNGNDGHVKANKKDTPFEVHSPTEVDPIFSVRDFGCSMTDDEVKLVYTTYFASTKSESNVEVGGFGLGAKIPIAYTDQYTVTTYLKGVQTIYQICKQEGIPTMFTVGSTETNEPDGVLVEVPVKLEDIVEFEKAIEVYKDLSTFNFNTNLKCNKLIEITKTFKTENCVSFKELVKSLLRHNTDFIVRIGGVPYVTDWDSLYEGSGNSCYDRMFKILTSDDITEVSNESNVTRDYVLDFVRNKSVSGLPSRMLIDFPIGELEVTRSRENIQTSSESIRKIIKSLLIYTMKFNVFFIKYSKEHSNMTTVEELKDYVSVLETNRELIPRSYEFERNFDVKYKGHKLTYQNDYWNFTIFLDDVLTNDDMKVVYINKNDYRRAKELDRPGQIRITCSNRCRCSTLL